MRLCPYRFTKKFPASLQSRFFVPNFPRQMDLIKRQFVAGRAEHIGGDRYQIMVKDIPAVVVMRDATLITIMEVTQ